MVDTCVVIKKSNEVFLLFSGGLMVVFYVEINYKPFFVFLDLVMSHFFKFGH